MQRAEYQATLVFIDAKGKHHPQVLEGLNWQQVDDLLNKRAYTKHGLRQSTVIVYKKCQADHAWYFYAHRDFNLKKVYKVETI
jgi:hypothetical protein